MAELVVKFWRDIPSMVSVGRGRRAARRALPERFEQAIDRVAMRTGAAGEDSYLAEWRDMRLPAAEAAPGLSEDATPEDLVAAAAARLDALYDEARLRALIDAGGWDPANAGAGAADAAETMNG